MWPPQKVNVGPCYSWVLGVLKPIVRASPKGMRACLVRRRRVGALMLTLCVSIFLLTVVWPDISGVGRSLSVRLALDREAARLGVKWTRVDQWESKKGNVSLGHGYVGLDSFLVVKEYRLLICRIDKNANQNLAILANRLNGLMGGRDGVQDFVWDASKPENVGIDLDGINEIMRDPLWTKAVFFRDPLERLLSAYISKCVVHEETPCFSDKGPVPGCDRVAEAQRENGLVVNGNCQGFEDDWSWVDSPVPFGRFVKYTLDEVRERDQDIQDGIEEVPYNVHYELQKHFCGGLENTIGWYDAVGRVGGALSRQVHAMLRVVGVRRDSLRTRDIFPLSPHQSHTTHRTDSARRMRAYYNDTRAYLDALELYAADYDFLGMEPFMP